MTYIAVARACARHRPARHRGYVSRVTLRRMPEARRRQKRAAPFARAIRNGQPQHFGD
jgi:hypothetical protein